MRFEMIKIEFNEHELQALIHLMDAGVKAAGLQSVRNAAALVVKLEQAIRAHNDAQAEDNVINFDDKDEAING